MITIDACGFSCPQPLLMLKNGLKESKEIMLLVDSKNAFTNCKEYAEKQNLKVIHVLENNIYKVTIK